MLSVQRFAVKMYGRKWLRNKRGSLQDVVLVGMFLLVFAIMILISFKVLSEINTKFQASDLVTAEGKAASNELTGFFPTVIDNSFLLFAVGLAIVVMILAFMVRIHPIFIPFFFLGLVVLVFVSGIFSNIYQELAATTELISIANQLTFTTNVLTYLPMFVAVVGTLLMIVMYKQWQGAQ